MVSYEDARGSTSSRSTAALSPSQEAALVHYAHILLQCTRPPNPEPFSPSTVWVAICWYVLVLSHMSFMVFSSV